MRKGDRIVDNLDGETGTIIVPNTTAPDAYGDMPVALVEWDKWKVRTYAPMSRLQKELEPPE